MSPLKNTDKHLSDYLPPALVKDWRQCFRSRSALLIFILLELAGWLLFFCMMADADKTPTEYLRHVEGLGEALYAFGVFTLCLAVPYRAGSTVAADTKVRSANFLMLTPLTARRIVWGTWSSTALIVLLAALCSLPLAFARQLMLTAYPHVGELNPAAFNWEALGLDVLVVCWVVLCGWVTTAFYMFAAGLPRLLRGLLIAACCLVGLFFMFEPDSLMKVLFCIDDEADTLHLFSILRSVLVAVLLIVLFLELARRHYAAPAENCSRAVRLIAPLPLLLWGIMAVLEYTMEIPGLCEEEQGYFALCFLYGALLADALLPTYAMPAHARHNWRWLPSWLQKPGLAPSAFCLALAALLFRLPDVVDGPSGSRLCYLAIETLNFGFTLLLWLLITDCLCRRSARMRPFVYGLVALACTFVGGCVRIPLDALPGWASIIPLAGAAVPYELRHTGGVPGTDVGIALALNGGAFLVTLLLLLCWRARVNKN